MAIKLKYSTAGQEIPLGYFVDALDGNTEETGLTIANTDIKLWKMGATALVSKNSGGATHMANGIYYCTLDDTDTNTLGGLVVFVHVSGALAVKVECEVVPANVYDAVIAGTDKLQVDTVELNGTAQTANDIGQDINDILADTADMQPKLGTPSNFGSGATLAANLTDIEAQTDDIGAAGTGLTAVPWNAAWDAEVQSEVQDAIEANHLDHLLAVSYDPDAKPGAATALLNEIIGSDAGVSQLTENALELAPSGGAGLTAQEVWEYATRTLSAFAFDVTVGTNNDKTGYSLASGQLKVKKNTQLANFMFLMVQAADHITPATGLTVSAQRSIDGGLFAACSNSVSEVGDGVYKITLAASDLNGDVIALKFTATGADQRTLTILTQA